MSKKGAQENTAVITPQEFATEVLNRLEQRRGPQNEAQRKAITLSLKTLYGKLNVQTVDDVIRVIRFTASIGGLGEDDAYDNDDWQGLDAKRFTALCTDREIHKNNMVVQAANFTTLWDMFTPAPAESIKSIVSGSSTLSHGSQGHPPKPQSKSVQYKETFLTSADVKHHCGHDLKGKSLWDVLPEDVKDYFFWNGKFRRLSHLKNITAIKTLMLEQKEKTSLATIEELVAQHIGSFYHSYS